MKKPTKYTTVLVSLISLSFSITAHATPASAWKDGHGVVKFPNIKDSHFENPSIININSLNLINSKMSKREVVRLIGRPHYTEGAFAETIWNYIFRLKQNDGSYTVCQYQIHFERNEQHQLLTNKELYTTCATTTTKPYALNLSADTLFNFDKSSLKDLNEKGQAQLTFFAKDYKTRNNHQKILVSAYTDHLGSTSYNLRLSQDRADTIRDYLISQGLPNNAITAQGFGSTQPVVTCDNSNRSALIECLRPNRRVRVELQP